MSVVEQIDVRYRRFSGYLDPRYPEGHWFARASVTGDGSGGFATLSLVFAGATLATRNSRIYSLEQMSVSSTETTERVNLFTAANMGTTQFAQNNEMAVRSLDLAFNTPVAQAVEIGQLSFLPLFLGSQRFVGTTTSIDMLMTNVNAIVYNFEAQGYWWGPRSVLVDGGPQRPPSGLYRA